MGTGFSIDTPLRVARYGISSVISLVDDILIEHVRRHHCATSGEPYEPIGEREPDGRARRITAYLDLLHRLIVRQAAALRQAPFEPGSEITRYFELLPESPLKQRYRAMLACADPGQRTRLEDELRAATATGSIDVNIMTKLDRLPYRDGKKLAQEFSDAMAALRGYANSVLCSSIVFSAGLNPPLYSYLTQFKDFLPDADGTMRKQVVIKVSDFRSALVQGRYLAKRGIWVSEFRIESGLNCGGHAFASKGELAGPILQEFHDRREELAAQLMPVYAKSLASRDLAAPTAPPTQRITYQGGVASATEHAVLATLFGLDSVGWATPFLLVPEATCVDEVTRTRLVAAGENDVYLGEGSPMGIPFWTLRNSPSEEARRRRIERHAPGSGCPKGVLELDCEFTDIPICRASRAYQALKLADLAKADLPDAQRNALREDTLARACICHDLGGGAAINYGFDPAATPAVCPSMSVASFSQAASLDDMIGHIYGRLDLLTDTRRPHVFLRELALYIANLRHQAERYAIGLSTHKAVYFAEFRANLMAGVAYYRAHAARLAAAAPAHFLAELTRLESDLASLALPA
jgi:hypothetical protein